MLTLTSNVNVKYSSLPSLVNTHYLLRLHEMSSHPDSLHISSLEAEPGQGEKESQLALESREKVTPSDIREEACGKHTKLR